MPLHGAAGGVVVGQLGGFQECALLAVVGEDEFGGAVGMFPVIKNAFFGQQTIDEGQGGFAILDGIFPRQMSIRETEFNILDAVFGENLFDDVRHADLLEDARIRGEAEAVQGGTDADFILGPVAGEA